MATVALNVSRVISTKAIVSYSTSPITPGPTEEVVVVNVPEEDVPVFGLKYRFNAITGVLEINGLYFYRLEVTTNAASINPITGNPQVAVGGGSYITITLKKIDLNGAYHLDPTDDDTVDVNVIDGERVLDTFDLVNGIYAGEFYSSTVHSSTTIEFTSADMGGATLVIESV